MIIHIVDMYCFECIQKLNNKSTIQSENVTNIWHKAISSPA